MIHPQIWLKVTAILEKRTERCPNSGKQRKKGSCVPSEMRQCTYICNSIMYFWIQCGQDSFLVDPWVVSRSCEHSPSPHVQTAALGDYSFSSRVSARSDQLNFSLSMGEFASSRMLPARWYSLPNLPIEVMIAQLAMSCQGIEYCMITRFGDICFNTMYAFTTTRLAEDTRTWKATSKKSPRFTPSPCIKNCEWHWCTGPKSRGVRMPFVWGKGSNNMNTGYVSHF